MDTKKTNNKLAEGFYLDDWSDAGGGINIRLRRYKGTPEALEYTHVCGSRGLREDAIPLQPDWSNGWKIERLEPLTLTPSLLCKSCGNHGFVRNGKWIPC